LGPAFYATLLAAVDEAQVEALLTERAEALRQASEALPAPQAGSVRPRSSEPMAALARRGEPPTTTATDFARAIRNGAL
jgi:hypothetical protein